MGVDTRGYLGRDITVKDIMDVVMTKYGVIENDIEAKEYKDGSKVECGAIFFKDGEDTKRF
jgi:hypothetical protein